MIAFDAGGRGAPLLVLLHGLGATAAVWTPMLDSVADRWPGRWIAPDLPGHGGSRAIARYHQADYVGALAPFLSEQAAGGPVTLLGHSLGGTLSLALAASGALPVARANVLGIVVNWTAETLARLEGLAARPPRVFDTQADALIQHAKLAGIADSADARLLARGVKREGKGWQTAMDPRAFAIEPPAVAAMLAAARCPLRFACGANDPMVNAARLRDFVPDARAIEGAAHNAMIDRPDAVWDWMSAA